MNRKHHQILKVKINDLNKVSKQHKTDALPETGDKSENTNATLFGAMMALLGSLLLFRKNASKIIKKKRKYFFRHFNTFVFGFFVENDFKVNCLSVKC